MPASPDPQALMPPTGAPQAGALRAWIGRHEAQSAQITPFPTEALESTLDHPHLPRAEGDVLPPLYHWLYFLAAPPLSGLNYDGHAGLGDFMPPVALPRRMWGGGRLQFHAPLRVGALLRRDSVVQGVTEKTGHSGPLVLVTLRHEVREGDRLCLVEEQDLLYREAPRADAPPTKLTPAPPNSAFSRRIRPDPVLLFRYSALTFNGHRIHYDLPFARREGYPGLVVHGPLLATLLADLLRRHLPQARLEKFSFRALAPVFDTDEFTLHGGRTGPGRVHLWVRRHDGALAMNAAAQIAQ